MSASGCSWTFFGVARPFFIARSPATVDAGAHSDIVSCFAAAYHVRLDGRVPTRNGLGETAQSRNMLMLVRVPSKGTRTHSRASGPLLVVSQT